MTARTVTDEDKQRVRELHAAGRGRNQIAADTGLAAGTVTTIARQLGLSFDRSASAAAVAARKADLAALRQDLEEALLVESLRLLEELRQPVTVYSFGGRDNTYAEFQHDEPDATAKLRLMQASTTALDRALKLAEVGDDNGLPQARSMLGSLLDSLKATARPAEPAGTP